MRCGSGVKARRPSRTASGGDAVGPGQGRGGEGVGQVVRGEGRGAAADVVEGGQLGGRGLALLDEGPVGEDVVDDADHRQGRRAEGEADRAAALLHLGVLDEPLGDGVLHVVDAGDLGARVDLALGPLVLLDRAVPVDVVGGDVEAGRGVGGDRVRPVQLEAGQLDGDHVVGLGVQHRLEDRGADVAGGGGAQPGRPQHRGEHRRRWWSCRWCR